MYSDVGLLISRMREELREALPPRAFLRRDRGEYLFVSNAPAFMRFMEEAPVLPGFIWELRGPLLAILPDESWALELERDGDAPDQLSASLMRFRGVEADRAGLGLLAQGWKLADVVAASKTNMDAEREDYERELRRRAALALRGACDGGGLYAGALLNAWLRENRAI